MQVESIFFIITLLISIIFHEVAHGYVAYRLGDPTAKSLGRLSLNPLVHLEWFGSVILPGMMILTGMPFVFGWAKPVPFNVTYFKKPEQGTRLVAAAGPLTNMALALFGAAMYHLLPLGETGALFFGTLVVINIVLAIFNLLPIPPLDGHHILFSLLPRSFDGIKAFLRQYALIILIAFLVFGFGLIEPLMMFVINILL